MIQDAELFCSYIGTIYFRYNCFEDIKGVIRSIIQVDILNIIVNTIGVLIFFIFLIHILALKK